VAGNDRQELLRQIAFEDPVPPRRHDWAVPAELETIVLKALEKNPSDRYATAEELADDLRRFLEDPPIRARRPSWVQVAAKWGRRHRPAVRAASALLVLAALLCGGVGLWWLQQRAGAQAEARAALAEAGRYQGAERWPEALSAARRAQGVLAGLWADRGLREEAHALIADLNMARQLQEARLRLAAIREGHFDWEGADAAYAAAFREYGLDVDGLDPQAAAQIQGRPICRQLVAALDAWALAQKRLEREGWRQRLAVARAADPDPWRNRLRDALEGADPKALEEAAAADRAEDWEAETLVLLGDLAVGTASGERVTALLARAQQRHPGDFWINETLGDLLGGLRPPRLEEAVRFYSVAVGLRPQSPGAHTSLGNALRGKGRLDEAIAAHRKATELQPDYPAAYASLGLALAERGRLDEAVAACRRALELQPDLWWGYVNLSSALGRKGRLDEAITACRKALALLPDCAEAYDNLGCALGGKGLADEAIAAHQKAIDLRPDLFAPYYNLGVALRRKGLLEEAIAAYRKAEELKPDFSWAHNNLGNSLYAADRLDEAVEELREALRLNKDLAPARANLSRAEQARRLGGRLPGVLAGKDQPKDAGERLEFAELCVEYKHLDAAAARLYGEAFAADPKRAEDLQAGHRYNAACAATLAGCGQGQDAAGLDDKERGQLRRQALDWLTSDLQAWHRLLEKEPDKARPVVAQQLQHWLYDPDFNGMRGAEALARLPEAERQPWQQLWGEVQQLLDRAGATPAPEPTKKP
jgi:serine/threonine-protein kinase